MNTCPVYLLVATHLSSFFHFCSLVSPRNVTFSRLSPNLIADRLAGSQYVRYLNVGFSVNDLLFLFFSPLGSKQADKTTGRKFKANSIKCLIFRILDTCAATINSQILQWDESLLRSTSNSLLFLCSPLNSTQRFGSLHFLTILSTLSFFSPPSCRFIARTFI